MFVFKHPFIEDLYIAMADRWLTDLPDDRPDMTEVYAAMFDEECDIRIKEKYAGFSEDTLTEYNTSKADYVWLPVSFENGVPKIRWYDEWRIEDFK